MWQDESHLSYSSCPWFCYFIIPAPSEVGVDPDWFNVVVLKEDLQYLPISWDPWILLCHIQCLPERKLCHGAGVTVDSEQCWMIVECNSDLRFLRFNSLYCDRTHILILPIPCLSSIFGHDEFFRHLTLSGTQQEENCSYSWVLRRNENLRENC